MWGTRVSRGLHASQDAPPALSTSASPCCQLHSSLPSQLRRGRLPHSSSPRRAAVRSPQQRRCHVVPSAIFKGFGKLFNSDNTERTRKAYQPRVEEINALEGQMQGLTDQQLQGKTVEFRRRLQEGATLDDLLVEAFAVVREASKRVLGLRPFDVQLMGGLVLHDGNIAEMKTGEGKTLVAILPCYLNALPGKGVQVVTVNDYLARRDSEWVGQVHRFLGLQVGLVQQGLTEQQRQAAYKCDVTYVTNSELGFDFLRDNLVQSAEALVLRPFNYCVIDEVDSILVDEARTPLIISGMAEASSSKYSMAARLAGVLSRGHHYTVDEKQKSILLTEEGYEAAEDVLQVTDLYDPREQWASFLLNALKAKELQARDVNYIVRGGEVIIVDEFTGRTMPGRRWSDGLHQAVEAKEGVPVQPETISLASISYQNFFRSYPKLAGMTGTALTEVAEFSTIYDLSVSAVPTNRSTARTDNPDVVFRVDSGKWTAVVTEIKRMHNAGRPVLVGTTSVEGSEQLAQMLKEIGVPYQLLNAKPENVERESEIVAQSGRRSAVTIATNMAGRGTDILLGGNPEFMARLKLREMLMPEVVSQVESLEAAASGNSTHKERKRGSTNRASAHARPIKTWTVSPGLFPCDVSEHTMQLIQEAVAAARTAWGVRALDELDAEDRLAVACERAPTTDPVTASLRAAFQAAEADYKAVTSLEKQEVVALGGLHVIGTERHESRRIDNQLRGRSGRQGDPGSTRYFLSLEDNLFRVFGGDRIKNLMSIFQIEDLPIESQMLTDALNEAQRKVEAYYFDIRRQLWEYDQVLNAQRDRVYLERRRALLAPDVTPTVIEYAEKTADDILEANISPKLQPEDWPLDALAAKMKQYCYLLSDFTGPLLAQAADGDYEALRAYLRMRSVKALHKKVEEVENVQEGLMQQVLRYYILSFTDNQWKEHLQAMKFLQQAVGLRGYAQRDPLAEYKLEGYNLFVEMMADIRRNVIYNAFMMQPRQPAAQPAREAVAA